MAIRRKPLYALSFGLLTILPLSAASSALAAQVNSRLIASAESVADEDTSKTAEATVWLKPHNQQQFDSTVSAMYQQGSPTYHHWLKKSDLSRFAPSPAEAQAVRRELAGKGLTVTAVDSHSLFVRVRGNVGTMQSAFNTQIKSLSVKGKVMRATTTEPKMSGDAATLVAAVTGLTEHTYEPHIAHPVDPGNNKVYPRTAYKASPNGIFYSSSCFRGIQSVLFRTSGSTLPIASYAGNRYGADITNSTLGTLAPCGYDALNLTTAYGLEAAYKKGLDGTGQTIVIVDAYGSSAIADDANTFSEINGLPALTSANFQVLYPLGPAQPTSATNAEGWAEETSLDVEWAHAMAPGANIVLVIAPTNYNTDLSTALFYAIVNGFGNVISNSYGGDEYDDLTQYPGDLVIANYLNEVGASLGISVNYATGDEGDFQAAVGVTTVSDLSASPYATAVGGTSLSMNKANRKLFESGWGGNLTKIGNADLSPVDPPLNEGFIGGSGGGESQFFPKPSWQSGLPGTGRQQPDVSMDADPYTGVEIIVSLGGVQYIEGIGGTSLACPSFSGVWAIANQLAGQLHGEGTSLGQAAPIIAGLAGTSALNDIVPVSSPTNTAGFIFDSGGTSFYSSDQLAAPLENTTQYLNELYNSPFSGSWFALTFGTDSSLVTAPGWDNVTGFGTPNGLAFIKAAAK